MDRQPLRLERFQDDAHPARDDLVGEHPDRDHRNPGPADDRLAHRLRVVRAEPPCTGPALAC